MSTATARKRGRAQSLDEQLRFAINNKRLVGLKYDGAPRIGEPHDYGIHGGILKLLLYQLQRANGNNLWAERAGWRMLWVSKIEVCIVSRKTFRGSRGSSYRKHLTWDELFARVK